MTEKYNIMVVLTDGTTLQYDDVINYGLFEDSFVLDMRNRQVFIVRERIAYYDVVNEETKND